MNNFGDIGPGFLRMSRMDDTFDMLVQRAHDLLRTIELTILLIGCFTTPVQGEDIITEAMLILKTIGSTFDPKFTRISFILHYNLGNSGFEVISWNRRTLTIFF